MQNQNSGDDLIKYVVQLSCLLLPHFLCKLSRDWDSALCFSNVNPAPSSSYLLLIDCQKSRVRKGLLRSFIYIKLSNPMYHCTKVPFESSRVPLSLMKIYVDILSKNSCFYDQKNAVFWQTSSDFCFLYREEITSNFLGKSHLFFVQNFSM